MLNIEIINKFRFKKNTFGLKKKFKRLPGIRRCYSLDFTINKNFFKTINNYKFLEKCYKDKKLHDFIKMKNFLTKYFYMFRKINKKKTFLHKIFKFFSKYRWFKIFHFNKYTIQNSNLNILKINLLKNYKLRYFFLFKKNNLQNNNNNVKIFTNLYWKMFFNYNYLWLKNFKLIKYLKLKKVFFLKKKNPLILKRLYKINNLGLLINYSFINKLYRIRYNFLNFSKTEIRYKTKYICFFRKTKNNYILTLANFLGQVIFKVSGGFLHLKSIRKKRLLDTLKKITFLFVIKCYKFGIKKIHLLIWKMSGPKRTRNIKTFRFFKKKILNILRRKKIFFKKGFLIQRIKTHNGLRLKKAKKK